MAPLFALLASEGALRTKVLLRAVAWTSVVLLFGFFGLVMARNDLEQETLARVREAVLKDLAYRIWATHGGGVYAPVDENTPPNQELARGSSRDVTIGGISYAPVNPSYLTRRVRELGAEEFGLQSHLTSLQPTRPDNAADSWERAALERFQQGERERWETVTTRDGPALRYMKAFIIEKGCLRCHASQGYKVGDVRGGISATAKLDLAFGFPRRSGLFAELTGLAALWLLGLIAIVVLTWRDWELVDSLRRASDELRTEEALFRSLVDSLPFYLIRLDTSANVQFVNASLLRFLNRRLDECVGHEPAALLPPDTVRKLLGTPQRPSNADTPVRVEIELPGSSEPVGVELVRTVLRDTAGMPNGLQVVFWDASQKMRTEAALQEQAGRFRSLLDSTLSGYARIAADGSVLDVNESFAQMLGIPRERLIGKNIGEFGSGESGAPVVSHLSRARELGNERHESTFRRADGSLFEAEISTTAVTAGDEFISFIRDISAEKQAARLIRESEERYRTLSEQCPFPVFIHQKGKFVYCNPASVRLFKVPSGESLIGRDVMEFVHPDFIRKIQDRIQSAAESGRPAELTEEKLLAFDGSTLEVEVRAVPTLLYGEPAMLVFADEVSARNVAIRALKDSETRLSTLFESVVDGLFLVTVEATGRFVFVDVNPSFLALTELTRDKVFSNDVGAVLAPGIAAAWTERFHEAIRDKRTVRWEEQFESSRGVRHVAIAVSPTFDESGISVYVIGSLHDITERKVAEAAILARELNFRNLFENANDALYIAAGPDRFFDVNPMAEKMLGYSKEELLALGPAGIDSPESKSLIKDRIALINEKGGVTFEAEHVRKDGQRVAVEISARMIHYYAQPAILSVARDITERKRAEAERRHLESEVQKTQRLESLGSLAGGVAHDMNNVLAAILGLASAHRAEIDDSLPLASDLDTIVSACTRGRAMVRGLLDFARRGLEELTPIDINRIVEDEVQLLSHTTLQKIEIVKDLHTPLLKIKGDAASLSHALMNVCLNAVDAMDHGGTLKFSTRNLPEGMVELIIRDNGHGMTADVLAKAVDPFFTTKPAGKGTGLGLAIAYGTVKAHGGLLEIESEPGTGTAVRMRFPAITGHGVTAERPQETNDRPAGRKRILLVDDDELIRAAVPRMLKVLGHEVVTASGGREALDALANGLEVELMILDLNMPGMNGIETLSQLDGIRPELPVLVATGYKDPALDEVLTRRPQTDIILKPFTMDELRARISASVSEEKPDSSFTGM